MDRGSRQGLRLGEALCATGVGTVHASTSNRLTSKKEFGDSHFSVIAGMRAQCHDAMKTLPVAGPRSIIIDLEKRGIYTMLVASPPEAARSRPGSHDVH